MIGLIYKRKVAVSILLLLVLSLFVTSSYQAADDLTLSVSDATLYRGEQNTVEVRLTISQLPLQLASLYVRLNYDPSVFDVEVSGNGIAPELVDLGLEWNVAPDRKEINFVTGAINEDGETVDSIENVTFEDRVVTVAEIKFTAKSGAALGTYPITIKEYSLGALNNAEPQRAVRIPAVTDDGSITIRSKSSGGGGGSSATSSPSPSPSPTATPTATPGQPATPTPGASGVDSFGDVTDSYSWAKAPIDALVKAGIISGTSPTSFEPERSITRAEFCKLIVKAFNFSDVSAEQEYLDVNSGDWFYEFVKAAAAAGVVNGYDDGSFKPGATITREEMAAMLIRAFQAAGIDVSTPGSEFSDQGDIADWAADYVVKLAGMGIVNGREGNLFVPKGQLTRAESAKVIYMAWSSLNPPAAE